VTENSAGDPFPYRLPAGFPPPEVPRDNRLTPAAVLLGRALFYDTRLSGNGTQACAGCHRQALAFTDGRARARGSTGELHARSAMSLANVAYSASLTWAEPGLSALEDQVLIPMFGEHPVELGLAGRQVELVERLRADPIMRGLFGGAFPGEPQPITVTNITRAIASFERTLLSGDSPYDRYVYNDDMSALTAAARRGMRLFFSERLRCSACHGGFTLSGPVRFTGAADVEPVFHNTGLYNLGGTGAYPAHDRGLYDRTGRAEDMGRFRAPTLRNIALTAPYMHDGSVATLHEVITHYAEGGRTLHAGRFAGRGRDNRFKSERLGGFTLADGQEGDLVEFLEHLTDLRFVTDPRHASPARDELAAAAGGIR
jgi:cytochrome c peroxidase